MTMTMNEAVALAFVLIGGGLTVYASLTMLRDHIRHRRLMRQMGAINDALDAAQRRHRRLMARERARHNKPWINYSKRRLHRTVGHA